MVHKYLKGQTGMKDISHTINITEGKQTNLVIVPTNMPCINLTFPS